MKHLIKRTGFGVPPKLMHKLKDKPQDQLLEIILKANNILEAPINNYNDVAENKSDSEIAEGQSFVLAKFDQLLEGDRNFSIKLWMFGRDLESNVTIQKKIFFFGGISYSLKCGMYSLPNHVTGTYKCFTKIR